MDKILEKINRQYDAKFQQKKADGMLIIFNIVSFFGGLALFLLFLSLI